MQHSITSNFVVTLIFSSPVVQVVIQKRAIEEVIS